MEDFEVLGSIRTDLNGYTTRDNGTALSTNAEAAEMEGKYSAGTFRKNYKVATSDWEVLCALGIVENTEWHHTGKNFKETQYFAWGDHHDRDYTDGQVEKGSYADIYKKNKKKINSLVSQISSNDFKYVELESGWLIPELNDYLYRPVRDLIYNTPIEEEYIKEHERISSMSSVYTSAERRELHEKVDEKYRNEYMDVFKKQYIDIYGEKIEKNKKLAETNAKIKANNLKLVCSETYCVELCSLFGIDVDKAYDMALKYRYYSQMKARSFEEKRKKEDAKIKYDAEKEEFEKWKNSQIKKGSITYQERIKETNDLFITEKEEMYGKYGFFNASNRYNLPKYYSGYQFKSKKMMEEYKKRMPKFHLNGEFYTPVNHLIIDSNEHFFKLQVKELFEDRKFEDFKVVDGTFDVRLLDENGKSTGLRYRYLYYPETVNEEMIKVCDYFETLGKFAPQYVAAFSDRPMFKNFNDADAFLKSYKNGIKFIDKILQNGNQCLSEIHNDFPLIFFVSDDKRKMIECEVIIKTELSKIKSKFLIQKIIVALKELLSKIEVKHKNIINERLGYVENRLSEIEKYGGWISTKRKIFESLNVKKAPSTFKYEDYISNETINRPSLCGIFHDRGYKIASNAQILVALKEDYDPKLEGKITWTEKVKEDIENSGFDLSNAEYPKWESVIPSSDTMKSIDIDWNEVLTKANRTENLAKVYGDKHSCFVMVCGEKNYCIDPTLLKKFAKAAIKIGASNLYYNDKKWGGALLVENEKGKVFMTTMAPRNIVDSDYMYPYGIYIANNNTSDSKLRLAKARAKAIIIRQRQRARNGMKGLFGEY